MDVEAVGGNKAVLTTVVVGANVQAVGGSDVVVGGSDAAVEVACSMSIGGAGRYPLTVSLVQSVLAANQRPKLVQFHREFSLEYKYHASPCGEAMRSPAVVLV
uniref:Uncharacterized protein n=1 Tax=Romanomermis culicivorax TaxID=13658 RepID=A0A915IXJ4_ROMCU